MNFNSYEFTDFYTKNVFAYDIFITTICRGVARGPEQGGVSPKLANF